MKKVLIAQAMQQLIRAEDFFDRSDIQVFTATTNDELLKIHIEETANLIVTKRDMPGTDSETIFNIIRQGKQLRDVLVIMTCESDALHLERCRQCGPSAILTEPVEPELLREKVRQYLSVVPRRAYRVVLSATVDGKFRNQPFLCRTENISAAGALIRAELELAPGDIISCSFYLPDGTRVLAQGEVVRAVEKEAGPGGHLYGINYTQIASDVKAKIEAYARKEQESGNAEPSYPRSRVGS